MRGPWFLLGLLSAAVAQNPFTLEEVVTGQFAQRGFNGRWISDTEFTYVIPGEPGIYVYDASTLESRVLVSSELMEFLNTTNPILSADRDYILAPSEVEQVYRYSTTAKYALYEIASGNVKLVADHQRLQLCIFGGGHSLAYVLDNNVYYLPENSTQAIQLTDDGIPGVVYNGHTDWVYEEDVMYTSQATWFSPDGSYLAFASYNDSLVDSYSYYHFVDKSDPDDLYPELVDLKYPKAGLTNPTVSLRVINLNRLVEAGVWEWQTLAAPEAVTDDHILGGVVWPTTYELAAHWLNRRQNYTVLRFCNVVTGLCPEEEHRQQPNGWIPIALPRFSRNGDFYVSTRWSLEQADGNIWQHLYLSMRINGQIVSSSITPGSFTVNNYVGMDESTLSYYFTRTVPNAPWQSQVHAVGAQARCLSCNLVLPDGGPCSWATATASLGGSFMSITCSSPEEPSATFIINPRTSQVLTTWEDNAIVRDRLIGKNRPGSIITTVPLQNGFPAPVRLFLPPGLDVNDTETKYAMVFYVYSGPGTNNVFDTFTVDNDIGRNGLIGKNRPGSIITTVPLQNGSPAPVRLFLPPGLDVNDTETKYAMVFYVYSGPGTNNVFDTFTVDNDIGRNGLIGKNRPGSIITTVPLQNGSPAPVRLFLPPGLNVNDTETKYAMVFYVYSGTGTNNVFDTFTVGYHSYLTTSRNVIYMLADGRGSGLKGQDILFSVNNALGTVEIEDHSVILREVLDRYQFIDRSRVGIWGHSYGGYATLLTLLHDNERLFRCGVSGAPVTSWLYYNTMYTERYMGLPTPEDNLAGYQAGDVTLLAEKLRGHDFYLMHGNADDNVHYQNQAKLMKALQQLDIPFEQMSYPDEAHSLAGVSMHRYNAMNQYWTRCLRL